MSDETRRTAHMAPNTRDVLWRAKDLLDRIGTEATEEDGGLDDHDAILYAIALTLLSIASSGETAVRELDSIGSLVQRVAERG